jgi:hypothetical protein
MKVKNDCPVEGMVLNESLPPLVEMPATLEEWKAKAEALWTLLDDIDTYGDMYKPIRSPYFRAVNKKAQGRFAHMESDGHKIINTSLHP